MNGYMAFYKNLCEYYDIDVTDVNVSTSVTNDNVVEVYMLLAFHVVFKNNSKDFFTIFLSLKH